ncbi:MAG: ABC transporter permease [Clostridia bacterium]|nr:ABC transporter permease [Clostridia bacterium]
MNRQFERLSFGQRVRTMLTVDFRRMFKSLLVWILIASCLVAPIAITVMVEMMEGTIPTDPQTGEPGEPIEGFDSAWQIIGSVMDMEAMGSMPEGGEAAGGMAAMEMDITSMCNINMLYFFIAVLVCIFIAGDFRSGYAKNLFTVRAKKTDYVISKTVVCFVGGALMILAFFVGSLLGGAISGLPFDMVGFNGFNLAMCILSKMVLVSIFVAIYVVMAVVGKGRAWLSLLLSFGVGMFLFMMIPMVSPLNATPLHLLLCTAGGAMFTVGLGAVSNTVLKKTSLV